MFSVNHDYVYSESVFALIILGTLLLIIAPQINPEMPELAPIGWIAGLIIGGIGFYLKFFRDRVKHE